MSVGRTSTVGNRGLSTADAAWPGKFRRMVQTNLRAWGRPELIETAGLLISELVTNAFEHGRGPRIRVRLYCSAHEYVIEVRDGSHERPVLRHATADDHHGRGLLLVDALAASWGVSEGGMTTWCALPLDSQLRGATRPLRIAEGEEFA